MTISNSLRRFVRRLLHTAPPARQREHDGTRLANDVRDAFGPAEGGVDGGGGAGHRYFEDAVRRDGRR